MNRHPAVRPQDPRAAVRSTGPWDVVGRKRRRPRPTCPRLPSCPPARCRSVPIPPPTETLHPPAHPGVPPEPGRSGVPLYSPIRTTRFAVVGPVRTPARLSFPACRAWRCTGPLGSARDGPAAPAHRPTLVRQGDKEDDGHHRPQPQRRPPHPASQHDDPQPAELQHRKRGRERGGTVIPDRWETGGPGAAVSRSRVRVQSHVSPGGQGAEMDTGQRTPRGGTIPEPTPHPPRHSPRKHWGISASAALQELPERLGFTVYLPRKWTQPARGQRFRDFRDDISGQQGCLSRL